MDRTTALRVLAGTATAFAVGALLVACSSSSSGSKSPGAAGGTTQRGGGGNAAGAGGGQFGAGRGGPAASGLIAAVDPSDIQVQNASTGQTEVTFTSSTRFTETKATTRAALKVGVCVVALSGATGAPGSSGSSSAPSTSGTGAVTEVTVTAPRNGTCTGGFGGGAFGGGGGFGGRSGIPGGGRSGSFPRNFPSGRPSNFPSGFPGGGRGGQFGAAVIGKVSAISGNTVTVQAITRTPGSSSTSTAPKTVTLGASTKYLTTGPATKTALKVGKCASAQGKTGSTGAVAATTIQLSPATANGCTVGFGRRTGND